MSRAWLTALLVASQPVTGAQVPEPSSAQLEQSITVYDPSRSVTVYSIDRSVTVLQTEEMVAEQMVVSISSDVLFDFSSAALTPAADDTVRKLAARVTGTTGPVTVVGHTDSVGDDDFNQKLSNQRAQAVGEALRAALPAGAQVVTEGRGAKEPVAPNTEGGKDNPAGRALNRRVTISFRPPG